MTAINNRPDTITGLRLDPAKKPPRPSGGTILTGKLAPWFWSAGIALAMGALTLHPRQKFEKSKTNHISTVTLRLDQGGQRTGSKPGTQTEPPASGETGEDKGKRNEYLIQVLRRIEANKRYPLREKQQGIEGGVRIRIELLSDGSLKSIGLITPSPISAFNQEALASVRRSVPFPPFPPIMKQESLGLVLQLDFKIR
ncbi:MAG: energy transducer TonB [Leptospiraceae bacterium]|nr:energy transducer TonB [Leptospiraceae bacterium]